LPIFAVDSSVRAGAKTKYQAVLGQMLKIQL
jgi:hypothetical protein